MAHHVWITIIVKTPRKTFWANKILQFETVQNLFVCISFVAFSIFYTDRKALRSSVYSDAIFSADLLA